MKNKTLITILFSALLIFNYSNAQSGIFFSEYAEGTSNNKYLEIYNPTTEAVSLDGDTDTSDATKGLQTNDGRVLGAIQKDDWIQFVSTTTHGNNANAAIYHGYISNAQGEAPQVSARVFYHSDRDYGYPNIAWTGAHPDQIQCLIGFNYTSIHGHPGVGAVQLGNDTTFSDPIDLKAGTTYVDRHSDSYERWGDYFAIQNMYDATGELIPSAAWMAGFYGDGPQHNRTYIAPVFGQDTLVPPHPDGGVAFPNPIV